MPVTGTRTRAWNAYRSRFSKDKEAATPGYYTVELSDPQVKAELTASIHAALHRYTYHKADSASVLIDLQHGPAWREEQYHSQVNSCEVNWEALPEAPLIYVGGLVARQKIDEVLDAGFEAVQMGRALLNEPGFVNRMKQEEQARCNCGHSNYCIGRMYSIEMACHQHLKETLPPCLQ